MNNFTHFRCNSCKLIARLEERVNNCWTGWDAQGKLKPVDNYCCPSCNSNDLSYRAPGAD